MGQWIKNNSASVLRHFRHYIGILLPMFILAACGDQREPAQDGLQEQEELSEYVYVADYADIGGETPAGTVFYHDGYLYWEEYDMEGVLELGVKLFRSQLSDQTIDQTVEEIPIALEEDWLIYDFIPADDGNLYCLMLETTMGQTFGGANYYFLKYDYEGNELYRIALAEYMEKDAAGFDTAVDREGHAYIYTYAECRLLLFDENGDYYGSMEPENYLSELICDSVGRIWYLWTDSKGSNRFQTMAVINYEEKTLGEVCSDIPLGLIMGGSKTRQDSLFIKVPTGSLYEYDRSSQQSVEVLQWQCSDINGNNVEQIEELADGRLLAIVIQRDFTGKRDIAFLTKTKRDQIVPKEELVIGVMDPDISFEDQIREFNKQSSKYRIVIRDYFDNGDTFDAIAVGRENLQMDITTGNEPDIYYLPEGLLYPIEPYAAMGLFEDLGPYLDRSENYDREDFVESVLKNNTYAGILISIPPTFRIDTLVGPTSLVGRRSGWTLEEFGALMDAYPEAWPVCYKDRYDMLRILMGLNQDAFIDWDTGECRFDSEEFIQLLECIKKFRSWGYDNSFEEAVKENKVLLDIAYLITLYRFDDLMQTFGGEELTFIGYPTLDGSPCHRFYGVGCAISSRSEHKEAAWEFLEYLLDHAEPDYFGQGLLSEKARLEQQIREALSDPFETDENGEILLDENGEPVRRVVKDSIFGGQYYVPLPEAEELIWELVSSARCIADNNNTVMNIIEEEIGAYYTGQKTAEKVAEVIQGRIQVYVNENR